MDTPAAFVDRPDLRLADPPAGGRPGDPLPVAARAFRILNRYLMTPMTRAGLGAWLSTPVGGAIVLLRIRGRKTGIVRETPLNYLIAEGSLWVIAGFGPRTEWYRNLVADPAVEAVLPGRVVTGTATEVRAPAVRRRIIPALLRSTAGPSLLAGLDPWRTPVDELLDSMAYVPLLRIDVDAGRLDPGQDDPGGQAWIWRQALVLAGSLAVLRLVAALARLARHSS
jgi:deazaflavin-dependent oxidoreductase (nitroreductase family)